MNCWEFKGCGEVRKSCPAYPKRGKDCWKVTGTKCHGVTQISKEAKICACRECDYYNSEYVHKF